MFQNLPAEIQDMVWRQALEFNAPTVHGVEIRRTQADQPGTRMVKTILWNSDTGVERPPIFPVRSALRQTCRGSQAALRRETRNWQAAEPYTLQSDRPWVASQQADLSRDLFVLSRNYGEQVEDGDKIEGVKYVGVTWEGFWDVNLVEKLDKVMALFPDLVVIYVVVAAASTIHPNLEDWRPSKTHILQDYLDRCNETASKDTAAIDFRSDGLIYREISPERLAEMGRLHEPMTLVHQFFTDFQERHQQGGAEAEAEDEPEGETEAGSEGEEEEVDKEEVEVEVKKTPVIRIMTWERAHRVCPRFP